MGGVGRKGRKNRVGRKVRFVRECIKGKFNKFLPNPYLDPERIRIRNDPRSRLRSRNVYASRIWILDPIKYFRICNTARRVGLVR